MIDFLGGMIGKIVDVSANGITYRGKLVEVGETDVYILADSGWIVIPTQDVTAIESVEE